MRKPATFVRRVAIRTAVPFLLPLLLGACASRGEALPVPQTGGDVPLIPEDAVEAVRTEDNGDVVTEYRVAGQLRMVKVVPFIQDFARSSVEVATCFVAECNGEAIAAAALFMHEGVALLAGASTVPEGRRQGAQLALLDARLRTAAEHGCDLAMMVAAPGSASQRNAERNGFRVAYTRTKWQL